ncbi:peptidoglycan-binding protein [Streptomyces sp. S.PB5]|uniref:peptidoglycan-binding protein n=1 Tax=Streptomyces sp. S.PB5 TaxID=3020844 RepID=UPI0025B13DE0|nr:peptidoglycan-binding protein [Streptomyces sp. S.PB5]MDN3028900.1 peptidoglycan-binding protein [Streptomyces sp. S.PB5]
MSRWKPLPAELDPRVRQLVVRLRRLKDHSGLSVRQLAVKTSYSPKSWERYLSAKSLPPQDAVTALARIAGDDPTRLLALHELAAEAWKSRPTTEDESTPSPAPRRITLVVAAVALVLVTSTATLIAVHLAGNDNGEDRTAPGTPVATSQPPQSRPTYTCTLKQQNGDWYAGNSTTRTAILMDGMAGPDVAEAQCLLRRAGISPGEVDGMFGPLTQGAVKRMQKREGLVVDGIIGPHTWKALRG